MSTDEISTETYDTGIFIDRDPLYLPGIPLTGQQLDNLEAARDEIERRTDLAVFLGMDTLA